MLILPPYQRKGHGRRLLTAIYNDFRKDSRVQDITGNLFMNFRRYNWNYFFFYLAEDPSDNFIALRDLVSLELCHKYLRDLFSKESILKTERLTKAMIDKAREVCKLTKVNCFFLFDFIYLIEFIFSDKHNVFMKCVFLNQLIKIMKKK
jgi:hypothetical protein